jgi:integrase
MAQSPFRIKPYKHPIYRYVVRDKITGTWRRKYFTSEREARTYVNLKTIELQNHGRDGVMFPAEMRVMAQRACDQLQPFGKTIEDAVGFYLQHLQTESRSIPVRQAVEELIANRAASGLSRLYLRDLKYRLGRFVPEFGERIVASVTALEITRWLESLGVGPVTRNSFRRIARTLFSFCLERKYCVENPVASKQTLAKEPHKDVEVLSVEQARKLLKVSSPEMVPYWAIGLFAGLRPSEIRKLQWDDVDFEHGLITVRSAKTGRKRYVTMQPNLIAWLKSAMPKSKQREAVTPRVVSKVVAPVNFRRSYAMERAAAGLGDWAVNCLRHSFGSYHLAQFANLNALALEMGNSPEVIDKHYRQAVRPQEAHRYWAITPAIAVDPEQKVAARIAA